MFWSLCIRIPQCRRELESTQRGSMRLPVATFAATATLHTPCFTQAFSLGWDMPLQRSPASHDYLRRTVFHDDSKHVMQHGQQHLLEEQRWQQRRRYRGSSCSTSTSKRSTALRMVFDPDVTPVALESFHKWLATKKDTNLKFADQIALGGRSPLDGGRGLVAIKAIENGKNVLAIPQSLSLTATSLAKSGIARYVKDYEGWTGDTGMIALQILWEKAQGEKSPIAPWIAVLPGLGELDMPLFWSEEDLALADASSTKGISGFGADVDEDYAWLAKNVFGANPTIFPEDKFGPADFRWAVGVALSRSFFVDGELRLTPLVDFANHASSRSMLEPNGGMTGLLGSKAVVLRAGKNYKEGEEFFVSYGPKGAAGYLEENGFVPPMSTKELTCELEFSIAKEDRFFDDKEDILQEQDLSTSATFELTPVGSPNPQLIQFLRLSMIGGEDAFLLESIFRNEVWDFMAEPVSPGNEAAVNEALASRCRAEMEGLHGTSEDEEDILAGKQEATPRQRLCATVRRGERLALKMTAEWCENDSKALDRKEYYQERRLKDLQLDLPLEVDDVYPTDMAGRAGRDMDW